MLLFLSALLVSLLVHLSSYISLGTRDPSQIESSKRAPRSTIRYKVVEKKQPKLEKQEEEKEDPDLKKKRIVETPMQPTEKPKDAKYLGPEDHATEKETKLSREKLAQIPKAADPGTKGKPKKKLKQGKAGKAKQPRAVPPVKAVTKIGSADRKKTVNGLPVPEAEKPLAVARNPYESFLNASYDEMAGEVNEGFQDYIDDKLAEGDRVDLNTKQYRYVAYFTTIRKSIELVWTYPMAARRRGMQGAVLMEFTIMRDGVVKGISVLESSGYSILDEAIVRALKQASPFPPLPKSYKMKKLTIVANFQYILSAYAIGH